MIYKNSFELKVKEHSRRTWKLKTDKLEELFKEDATHTNKQKTHDIAENYK